MRRGTPHPAIGEPLPPRRSQPLLWGMPSRRISPWGRVAIAAVGCVALAWLVSAALVIVVSRMDRARPSQAIIVLGAAQYGGRPSPVLRARLDHAIDLWQAGVAPRLIFTGGVGKGDTTSEAAVGRRYALRKGIPEAAILVEDRGRTTIESMHAVGLMMSGYGLDTAVLVSDPFHMLRLQLLAQQNGMVAYTSPTRTSPISQSRREWWGYVLSESLKTPMTLMMGAVGMEAMGE